MNDYWAVRLELDGNPAGELRNIPTQDADRFRRLLKLTFKDRVRTTTTVQWLRDEELKPPPPVSRPRTPYQTRR